LEGLLLTAGQKYDRVGSGPISRSEDYGLQSQHHQAISVPGLKEWEKNTGRVRDFTGPLSWPRGHKPNEQFLKFF